MKFLDLPLTKKVLQARKFRCDCLHSVTWISSKDIRFGDETTDARNIYPWSQHIGLTLVSYLTSVIFLYSLLLTNSPHQRLEGVISLMVVWNLPPTITTPIGTFLQSLTGAGNYQKTHDFLLSYVIFTQASVITSWGFQYRRLKVQSLEGWINIPD